MVKMFSFDRVRYSAIFASQGYVHIPGGLTEEFYQTVLEQVANHRRGNPLKEFAIGDKQQRLYEFPTTGHDYRMELCEAVGAVCGLDAEKVVISERHIKDYEADADPKPNAHKDRYATEIAVGFSIQVSPESTLVLYPHDERWVNPFNAWADLRTSLGEDKTPEQALKDAKRVEIQDAPRDVFMFRGRSTWHLRLKSAGTTMLYFKLNSFNSDPLGEDPRTEDFRRRTNELLSLSDSELGATIPLIGRRVDFVQRRYTREWHEIIGVVLWGCPLLLIDDEELRALRAANGQNTVCDVIQHMDTMTSKAGIISKIRRLANLGVIDLLPRVSTATGGE